tara:strand:+ start:76 stop:1266 length:1191 start_codon:yes stop_codon:yes gene_type:complete
MTLLDDVKLLTTANAGKAGTLYSIKPDDGSCDLDITRSTTATRVNPSGNIETVAINEPQIDYTDGCGCLLIEPYSTNLLTYSTGLPSGGWAGSGFAWGANSVVAPDGTTTGNLIEDFGGTSYAFNDLTLSASTSYSFSFYAKRGTATQMKYYAISLDNSSTLISQTDFYPLTNSSTWTRISSSFTTDASTTSVRIYYRYVTSGGTFALWGLQLEQHTADINMETSYIPTAGAIASRSYSSFIKTGVSSLIGSSEGVYFAEIAFFYNGTSVTSTQALLGINDSNNDAIYQLGKWGTTFIGFTRNTAGNSVIFSMSPPITSGSFAKLAVKYKAGDHAYWCNGVEMQTSTNADAIPATQDRVVASFKGINLFWEFYGKIRSIQVYNTALTDAQLLALTT